MGWPGAGTAGVAGWGAGTSISGAGGSISGGGLAGWPGCGIGGCSAGGTVGWTGGSTGTDSLLVSEGQRLVCAMGFSGRLAAMGRRFDAHCRIKTPAPLR
jgi:hypothetical protein